MINEGVELQSSSLSLKEYLILFMKIVLQYVNDSLGNIHKRMAKLKKYEQTLKIKTDLKNDGVITSNKF